MAANMARKTPFAYRYFVMNALRFVSLAGLLVAPIAAVAQTCGREGVALQVLGSGGPELQDKRAQSSYLVWQNGQARVLVEPIMSGIGVAVPPDEYLKEVEAIAH